MVIKYKNKNLANYFYLKRSTILNHFFNLYFTIKKTFLEMELCA